MRAITMPSVMAIGLATLSGQVQAEDPVIPEIWQRGSVGVGFADSIPSICISPTVGATNSWNAVGASFYLGLDTFNKHPPRAQQTLAFNEQNITIQRSDVIMPPDALMAAVKTIVSTGIKNADIVVSPPFLDRVQYFCSVGTDVPANKTDWESVVLHELGHAVGFKDVISPGCVMHESLAGGVIRRTICDAEKQAYIHAYGLKLKITSIPNVSGPQRVDIPAEIHYVGSANFPIKRETVNTSCPSGWSCSTYNGNYLSRVDSPLRFNFKCTNPNNMPSATFGWRTTLIDADGVRTNSIDHTSTCTQPVGASSSDSRGDQSGLNRIIITN